MAVQSFDPNPLGHYDSQRLMSSRLLSRGAIRNLALCTLIGVCALMPAQSVPIVNSQAPPPASAHFNDIAEKAGITMNIVYGGVDTKKYIIETTGTGVAIFDYDNDGWPDIFIVNGTRLEGFPAGKAPTNHLYRNNLLRKKSPLPQ
jgi:hypothetical protein